VYLFGKIQVFRVRRFLFANKHPHFCENAFPEQDGKRKRAGVCLLGQGVALQGEVGPGAAGPRKAWRGKARQG